VAEAPSTYSALKFTVLEADVDGESMRMDPAKILADQVYSNGFALMLRTVEFISKKLNAETNIGTDS
jgi:hypothetical protein